jgi:hypothetical protein
MSGKEQPVRNGMRAAGGDRAVAIWNVLDDRHTEARRWA